MQSVLQSCQNNWQTDVRKQARGPANPCHPVILNSCNPYAILKSPRILRKRPAGEYRTRNETRTASFSTTQGRYTIGSDGDKHKFKYKSKCKQF